MEQDNTVSLVETLGGAAPDIIATMLKYLNDKAMSAIQSTTSAFSVIGRTYEDEFSIVLEDLLVNPEDDYLPINEGILHWAIYRYIDSCMPRRLEIAIDLYKKSEYTDIPKFVNLKFKRISTQDVNMDRYLEVAKVLYKKGWLKNIPLGLKPEVHSLLAENFPDLPDALPRPSTRKPRRITSRERLVNFNKDIQKYLDYLDTLNETKKKKGYQDLFVYSLKGYTSVATFKRLISDKRFMDGFVMNAKVYEQIYGRAHKINALAESKILLKWASTTSYIPVEWPLWRRLGLPVKKIPVHKFKLVDVTEERKDALENFPNNLNLLDKRDRIVKRTGNVNHYIKNNDFTKDVIAKIFEDPDANVGRVGEYIKDIVYTSPDDLRIVRFVPYYYVDGLEFKNFYDIVLRNYELPEFKGRKGRRYRGHRVRNRRSYGPSDESSSDDDDNNGRYPSKRLSGLRRRTTGYDSRHFSPYGSRSPSPVRRGQGRKYSGSPLRYGSRSPSPVRGSPRRYYPNGQPKSPSPSPVRRGQGQGRKYSGSPPESPSPKRYGSRSASPSSRYARDFDYSDSEGM